MGDPFRTKRTGGFYNASAYDDPFGTHQTRPTSKYLEGMGRRVEPQTDVLGRRYPAPGTEYQRKKFYDLHDAWTTPIAEACIWYPAENNWQNCIAEMNKMYLKITEEYTGQAYFEQQMNDLLRKGQQNNQAQEVFDVFMDHDFRPDNNSWYRRGEKRTKSRLPAPKLWVRLQEFSMEVYRTVDPGGATPRSGRVYQGEIEDYYFVAAMQAIGMKPQLVANLFSNMDYSNPKLGLYIIRFYKHGQWVPVAIDDALPFDGMYNPLCITGEFWPDYGWPALVQKAYAKLHQSWSALGGGGHVEEAMTDLTGGCSCRFGTHDVAPDRLWQYLFEMQRWCVFAANFNEAACGKRSVPAKSHWATSIWEVKKYDGIPYVCVCTAAPSVVARQMPHCKVPSDEGYGLEQGFVWLRIDDFVNLFDIVYECRLVNSDLGSGALTGIPYSPGWVFGYPWYEEMWAFQGDVFCETSPSFLFHIKDVPSELTMEISQTDLRYDSVAGEMKKARHVQAPLLLRFYQCSENVNEVMGGEISLVHLSSWGHMRDAMCGVKIMKPGKFIARVTMPYEHECFRMIFRCYSTKPVALKVITQHKQWIDVQGGAPLHAIPYSLSGMMRIDSISQTLPQLFNEADGKGAAMANPFAGGLAKRGDRTAYLEWNNWAEELHENVARSLAIHTLRSDQRFRGGGIDGMQFAGRMGGVNSQASVEAAELQECCVM